MAEFFLKPMKARGVERDVSSSIFGARRRFARVFVAAAFLLFTTSLAKAAIIPDLPAPSFAEATSPIVVATPKPPPPDELVYKDGDRLRGRFIKREGDTLLFQSERFGLLRAPADTADVILAKTPTPAVAAEVKKDNKTEVAVERWPFSPLAMAAALKEFFGSWHGRFAVAAEMMQDGSAHNSGTVDAHLQRKWTKDEVQLTGRYDYALVDEVNSTDMIKGSGLWRHELSKEYFSVYRPTLEWNRAYYRNGVPADYVLLQEEFGAGINVVNTDTRKVRVGISENLFDTWALPTDTHTTQNVESVFGEIEAKLPWRIVLSDRGVWYYSITDQSQGWENRFEINKKLTETLTIGVRHELRHNNPDVRSADYRRLRLLFGFDF